MIRNYFQRMETVRGNIQEHCNAIQKILQQENEYWNEIHTAIDQQVFLVVTQFEIIYFVSRNLITANDIHPSVQNTSESLVNNDSPIVVEVNPPSSTENFISTKQERLSVVLPPINSNRNLPSVNKTYFVKLEETTNRSSTDIETSPVYSQPNLPARLYFSPTFLQDEESESIRNILSPLDQNQTSKNKDFSHFFH
jgi:hypothetical protein